MNYSINKIKLEGISLKELEHQLQRDYDTHFENCIRSRRNQKCHTCGSCDFKRHGSYERNIYLDKQRHILLKVMRMMCLSCNKTCVFLPYYIVKYKRYTALYLLKLLRKILRKSLNGVSKELQHSLGYLSYLYQQYLNQHELRVRALNSEAMICIKDLDMEDFLIKYLNHYSLNFMESKQV